MTPEMKIAKILIRKRKTLSIAESCTGGLIAGRITSIPGASRFFRLGLIVYSNEAKKKLLDISPATLLSRGAVSRVVAEEIAKNIRKRYSTDFGLGITGIAGPSGGTKKKPVGLVYIATGSKGKVLSAKYIFKGTRQKIRTLAATEALRLLLKLISSS